MKNLTKLKIALTIAFGMVIALVVGLINMPKSSVNNSNITAPTLAEMGGGIA